MASPLNNLVGTEVIIYPTDTNPKQGIIKEITELGILFEITKSNSYTKGYKVGTLHFIGAGSNLSFATL